MAQLVIFLKIRIEDNNPENISGEFEDVQKKHDQLLHQWEDALIEKEELEN